MFYFSFFGSFAITIEKKNGLKSAKICQKNIVKISGTFYGSPMRIEHRKHRPTNKYEISYLVKRLDGLMCNKKFRDQNKLRTNGIIMASGNSCDRAALL